MLGNNNNLLDALYIKFEEGGGKENPAAGHGVAKQAT